MTNNQEAAAAAATLSDDQPRVLLKDMFAQVAGCFPRRETRQAARQMAAGLLMELADYNCWSIAEAVGHRGPHRLQRLLSRAVWDDRKSWRRQRPGPLPSSMTGRGTVAAYDQLLPPPARDAGA
ncbi:MAG TPA: hypothetical protein VIY52_12020 [Streptosporangiaceae bacterium]